MSDFKLGESNIDGRTVLIIAVVILVAFLVGKFGLLSVVQQCVANNAGGFGVGLCYQGSGFLANQPNFRVILSGIPFLSTLNGSQYVSYGIGQYATIISASGSICGSLPTCYQYNLNSPDDSQNIIYLLTINNGYGGHVTLPPSNGCKMYTLPDHNCQGVSTEQVYMSIYDPNNPNSSKLYYNLTITNKSYDNCGNCYPNGAGIKYILQSYVQMIPPTTSTTTTGTTSIGTTTIPPPPPNPIVQIIVGIQAMFANFYQWLIINFAQYFNFHYQPLSIAITNITATNTTLVGNTITATINLNIPPSLISNKWTPTITKIVRTYCQAAVENMNTSTIITNSTITNMTSNSAFYQLTIKPATVGVYQFGALCQNTNTTFLNGAWQPWTHYVNVTSQKFAIYAVASGGPPPPPPQPSIIQILLQYFQNIICQIKMLLGYAIC